MKRTAIVIWNGSIKEGSGNVTTQSKALNKIPFSFSSRFEDGAGTNPEELFAAAHACYFAMKFSLDLSLAGFVPEILETECAVALENGIITSSHLKLSAKIPEITSDQFHEYAAETEVACPLNNINNITTSFEAILIT